MVEFLTLDGARANLGAGDIAALRNNLRGGVLLAGDPDYDTARRVWNGNVDRRPALIARCATIADVQHAVRFAAANGLLVSVRGGGHSAPGYGTNDGGMVIDLSPHESHHASIQLARSARAEGGVLWREFDAATQAHGLATTGGTVSNTGIAGLTLGGGLGWLMGKHGATRGQPDRRRGGHRRRLSSARPARPSIPTCFGLCAAAAAISAWSPRSNTGCIRSVRCWAAWCCIRWPRRAEMLRFYRDFCATLPDEAEAYAAAADLARRRPDGGDAAWAITDRSKKANACWRRPAGSATPLADLVAPMPYGARQTMLDAAERRARAAPLLALGLHRAIVRRSDRHHGGRRRPVQFAA